MKIAFIGLGAMGLPIARRLATGRDIQLSLFDTRVDRLDPAIGRPATSVADAVRDADAVFTVLPADAHVEAVAHDVSAAARPGLIFVDLSTIGPATISRVAEVMASVGVRTVSVALTRGTAAAEAGKLALFVGADGPLPAELQSAFDLIATETLVVGDLRAAKAVKIANNMLMGCLNVAMGEALIIGRKLGIAARALTADLERGADSWALRNQIEKHVLTGDLGPGHFATHHMAKDLRLYLEMAEDLGAPSYLAGVVSAAYRGVIAAGSGDDYHPVVIRWLERGASVTGDDTATGTADDRIGMLTRGVAAVQVHADLDALAILRKTGIEPRRAAGHVASGSGANAALVPAAEWLTAGEGSVDPRTVLSDLDRVVALADSASVPATMFEMARQCAVAFLSRKKNSTQLA